MGKHSISIHSREYPCRLTMGAMLEFKRRTGREDGYRLGHHVDLLLPAFFLQGGRRGTAV